MIGRLALLLAGLLWLTGCDAPAADDGRTWPEPAPALWHVSSSDGEAWLFGTVHALPDGLEWRTPAIENALARSDLLLVEIANLDDGSAATDAFEAISRAPPGLPPLIERINPPERAAFSDALAKADIKPDALDDRKTWAAALMLASALREYDTANGVDRALIAEAPQVMQLEGFARQYRLFDSLSQPAQVALLQSVLEEAGDEGQAQRLEAWLAGDIDRLEMLSNTSLLANPELRRVLLTERNAAWAARITAAIRQGSRPFVAVGAGHMLGAGGLPALLEARGFTVERID